MKKIDTFPLSIYFEVHNITDVGVPKYKTTGPQELAVQLEGWTQKQTKCDKPLRSPESSRSEEP